MTNEIVRFVQQIKSLDFFNFFLHFFLEYFFLEYFHQFDQRELERNLAWNCVASLQKTTLIQASKSSEDAVAGKSFGLGCY